MNLVLTSSPFAKSDVTTPKIMRHVMYALAPAVGASAYFFGIGALLVIAASVAGAVTMECVCSKRTIQDGSVLLTGILLGLTLPPGIPLWMAFLGAVFGVGFGKMVFGGFGQNVFNPALVGRAFLQAAFPVALTTWVAPGGFWDLGGNTLALPFLKGTADVVTTATPLARMKFDHLPTPLRDLFLGSTAGSLGETCALAILLGGAYLAARRMLNWRIPVAIFATVFLFSTILGKGGSFHLLSGGLVLGAVFMATDPVTSPNTHVGCWLFGAGVGILTVAIRVFGGLPEGVMYSILIMNAAAPLLSRITQRKIYGAR